MSKIKYILCNVSKNVIRGLVRVFLLFCTRNFFSIVWLHCSKVAKASTHRHSLEARDSVLLPFWPGCAPAPRGAAVDIRRTEIGERSSSSSSFSSPTEATSKAQSWQEILQRQLCPLTSHEPPKS